MGNLCSRGAEEIQTSERNRCINESLESDRKKQVKKLLFLGAGESGKSTLFKQISSLYTDGLDAEEIASYKPLIANNVLSAMKILIFQANDLGERFKIEGCQISEDKFDSKNFIEGLATDSILTVEISKHLLSLWNDPGVVKTFKNRAKFQIMDTTKYFMENLTRIADSKYIPTEQDILSTRVRTTGIADLDFMVDKEHFKLLDVGGQKNERKKWIHCFEDVTAVLFVAAISEYDQLLFEDDETNRLTEALAVFREIVNSQWFNNSEMILFLNKRDLFKEKLQNVPLSTYFPEYEGEDDLNKGYEFMKQLFCKQITGERSIYVHITCATDKAVMEVIFASVLDIIIRQSLEKAGLT
uniref:G-protein subunit alpha 2 n=1 Tax=Hirondellea gigas TaxID=1518452 RepID=A0A6A7G080_9CRUS